MDSRKQFPGAESENLNHDSNRKISENSLEHVTNFPSEATDLSDHYHVDENFNYMSPENDYNQGRDNNGDFRESAKGGIYVDASDTRTQVNQQSGLNGYDSNAYNEYPTIFRSGKNTRLQERKVETHSRSPSINHNRIDTDNNSKEEKYDKFGGDVSNNVEWKHGESTLDRKTTSFSNFVFTMLDRTTTALPTTTLPESEDGSSFIYQI